MISNKQVRNATTKDYGIEPKKPFHREARHRAVLSGKRLHHQSIYQNLQQCLGFMFIHFQFQQNTIPGRTYYPRRSHLIWYFKPPCLGDRPSEKTSQKYKIKGMEEKTSNQKTPPHRREK